MTESEGPQMVHAMGPGGEILVMEDTPEGEAKWIKLWLDHLRGEVSPPKADERVKLTLVRAETHEDD